MKKLVALLLGTAMMATSVAGLVACNVKPNTPPEDEHTEHVDADNNGKCDVCGEEMSGVVTPPDDVVLADRRVDPRAVDAYEAYDYTSTKIGSFKTIADAINATVEADREYMEEDTTLDGAKGGYVVKKGSTRHLFENKKGFSSGNSDQFWYYENGTELAGYNCWDPTNGMLTITNSKIITHETTTMGLNTVQSWNGYALLDDHGQPITDGTMVQSYELGSAMDASVLMFTGESKGVAGLKYKIDLTEVQITPPYEGVEEKVYAFIGIYAWQGYYVIANGIACDTETGDWYEYLGTSRDDSFSDVEYGLGEKIMSSTWTANSDVKGDGYWTPNAKELELEIKTNKKYDDFDDITYFEDDYTIKVDGKVAFTSTIGDEMVNNLFSGAAYSQDNTYVFTAGLDIKTPIETSVRVRNVDYFNGAKFLNLIVEEAAIYFPTEEEMTDVEAKVTIKSEWRGRWIDTLLANDIGSEGAYAYTVLQTYACTTYEAKDSVDYYSFRYDASPVSENEIGGQLKVYQDAIDSLGEMTLENVTDYLDTLTTVGAWYGEDAAHTNSPVLQQYLLLLDFAPYVAAKDIYEKSLALSDEAQAILDELRTLSTITAYGTDKGAKYLGWEAPEGTQNIAGYLYSELQVFHGLKVRFDALTDDTDKTNIIRLYGESVWDTWVELDEDVTALLANTELINSLSFNTFTGPRKTDKTDFEGLDVFTTAVEWIFKIKTGEFTDGENDGQGSGVMNFDGSAYPSIYLTPFLLYLENVEGFTFPGFILDQLDIIEFESFYEELWYPITNNVLLGAKVMNGYDITDLTEEELAFLNDVWTADYSLGAHINWNWISGAKFATYFQARMTRVVLSVGADTKYVVSQYIDAIAAWLESYGYEIRADLNGWGTTADVIDNSPEASDAAKAVVADFEKLSTFAGYTYKGWTTEDAETAGYLYTEVTMFRAVAEAYNALSTREKIYVNSNISRANYVAWETFASELAVVENSAVWNETFTTYSDHTAMTNAKKDYTGAEALHEVFKALQTLANGQVIDPEHDTGRGSNFEDENLFFSALWTATFVDHFVSNGVKLPTVITEKLNALKYDSFYTGVYYPLTKNVQLAQLIADGEIEVMEDLSDEWLAFLNDVWTNGYTISSLISWNWNDGNRFQMYWTARSNRLILVAGGTLTGEDTNALKFYQYMEVIANFLTENNYTVKDNGWGVTADKILGVTLTGDVVAFVDAFGKLTDINNYKYVGWTTDGGNTAGYLYTESVYFTEEVAPLYEALSEDDKDVVVEIIGNAYDVWAILAEEVLALNENETFMNAVFTAPNMAWTVAGTVTGPEALGQMMNGLRLITSGAKWGTEGWENDDGNGAGATAFQSDGHWMPSFRVIYFMIKFEELDVTLPEYVQEMIDAATDANAENLISDIRYIYTVLTLAKELEGNAELVLTDELIALVNANLVGREGFVEGGLAWNWNSGAKAGDLGYRQANYKLFFGLSTDTVFKTYLTTVVNYLVANCGATATESGMGITEEI